MPPRRCRVEQRLFDSREREMVESLRHAEWLRAELERRHWRVKTFDTLSARRLDRLSLAISIALVAPVAIFAQSSEVPRPIVDLKPGTANYKFRLEAAGQGRTMEPTRPTQAVDHH